MNKANNYFDFIVGTVVLLTAIIFLFFSFRSAKISSIDRYNLKAKFENADGIEIGSDVKISGIKIGKITEQTLDQQSFRAIFTLNIDNQTKIPADSSAKIVSEGLLGAKYIAITPGGAEENLSEGQEISFTQSSVNFEELLGKFIFSDKDKSKEKNH